MADASLYGARLPCPLDTWNDISKQHTKVRYTSKHNDQRVIDSHPSDPYATDKAVVRRNLVARERASRSKHVRAPPSRRSCALGWTHCRSRNGRDELSRTASDSAMESPTLLITPKTYSRYALSQSNSVGRAGDDTTASHIPGYTGSVRGWHGESLTTVGHPFGRATSRLDTLHAPPAKRTPEPFSNPRAFSDTASLRSSSTVSGSRRSR
eukprot:TRINITY_DN55502_c0_g1_i1.p1 TRINITY_DN55502_c0_g1~~TRINITY_DN55502_c0_g1_i1.p1  ORF type:complete len:231 (+),score=1.36 TRINITY_DN55502_c0_g1_i1:66-695(+)